MIINHTFRLKDNNPETHIFDALHSRRLCFYEFDTGAYHSGYILSNIDSDGNHYFRFLDCGTVKPVGLEERRPDRIFNFLFILNDVTKKANKIINERSNSE